MSERKEINNTKYAKVGQLFKVKRKIISKESRENFIAERSDTLFDGNDWISLRYLSSVERGKNLPSIEMLIKLAIALESDPVELFENIYTILSNK